ncbi:Glycerol dehydrogenase-related enzyme [Archaeoglobus sulfaticallidus PM70-1]|uniref:Glycerol-1-phosphate dehydrogenase [NAD(P)+] n=1 Tax=Archaeoglobus sulfaticallidus PM70-1 TaxID=387631 RepID=N0BMZ9_9EURY|nr:sn-glycerol-1-phosphate dehydrogenase [Archaeoglobus sulfaticallidus]AGK61981.1 Glycerol dehydrogenase-related enzyme [Archaeoglobus sulfaticallidus PM70-1]
MKRKIKREFLNSVDLPLFVELGEGPRKYIWDIIDELNLSSVYIIAGRTSYEVAGRKIAERINEFITGTHFVKEGGMDEVKKLTVDLVYHDIDCVMGIGGGKVLDVAKVFSSELNVPFISVPTVASHDGIASPIASFKEDGKPVSVTAKPPTAVIADLIILKHSPIRLLKSGYGDLISNTVAVKDWHLSKEVTGEDYNEISASMAALPAKLMLDSAEKLDFRNLAHLEMLVRGLILSGVAISIAGSSRPASGSEHRFSHALDYLGYSNATHGEKVALGSIIMEYLHEKHYGNGDWERIRFSLERIQAPTTAKEVGLTKEQILEALMLAKKIRRKRYSILEDVNPDKEDFEVVLTKTGIV